MIWLVTPSFDTPERVVRAFLDASVANRSTSSYLDKHAKGAEQVTGYEVARYQIAGVSDDVVSATIYFRGAPTSYHLLNGIPVRDGGTSIDMPETLRFRVSHGKIVEVFWSTRNPFFGIEHPTRMNLKDVLPYVGTSHLRDRVQEAAGEHADELPLEICCLHGGWPEPDRLIVGDIPQPQVDSGEIHVSIPVQFDESVATSCADIAFPEHVSREIPVRIDRVTGDVQFPSWHDNWLHVFVS
jgi:hypothetical protein